MSGSLVSAMNLFLKFFREENALCLFVDSLAEAVADEEKDEREADAEYNLVQVKGFDFQCHRYAVDDNAAAHSGNSTVLIRLRPEKTENQYPEKGCFQTAESEHINLPDNTRRINCDYVD